MTVFMTLFIAVHSKCFLMRANFIVTNFIVTAANCDNEWWPLVLATANVGNALND